MKGSRETICTHPYEVPIWYRQMSYLGFDSPASCVAWRWNYYVWECHIVIKQQLTFFPVKSVTLCNREHHLMPVPGKPQLARTWGDQQRWVLCCVPPLPAVYWRQQWMNALIFLLFTLCKHRYLSERCTLHDTSQGKTFRLQSGKCCWCKNLGNVFAAWLAYKALV